MKIPNQLIPVAYQISKQVYENQLTFSEGKNQLVGDGRMNSNSAADYINNFRYMMDGIRFTRTLNAFSMEYYFESIFKDYGESKLLKALNALKLHIEYYEGLEKIRMHKMRDIYDKYFAAVPVESPDEQEQNEIIHEIQKQHQSKDEILKELKNLKETDSEIVTINTKAFKRDNKTIAQIKILRDFKCQLCGTTIVKKGGGKYIEAAHIKAKNQKGRETLDNIILLCPNHHKAFDLGDRRIITHTKSHIEFLLNDEPYRINFE
ncbi:MAG TPA: HNH endonuclease [Chryseosolibacter sp.]